MNKQSGFTLIELVIVVVILGFLAVTAIPKFIDLTDQAKQANIEGMAGGFATAVSLARAQWEAEGRSTNTSGQNVVSYDGTDMLLTTENTTAGIRAGYVVASVAGENSGAGLGGAFTADNCIDIWNNILQQPPKLTNDINTLNTDSSMQYFVTLNGTAATTSCSYHLKETLAKDNNGLFVTTNINTVSNFFSYFPATSSVEVTIKQ
ncbi:type II secretion system protein [Thalassotalea profundi]|uniref:MSHA biogenesis protein MshB n=1 Tax=Thalassotalea profundi TaxID=2036687 RepID=A0ABQ3J2Z0_9GAMM|nr:prepilin-type N-terminal cleavage/methylation domain-containing protein [Thalassotalea profundi]GHE99150.1 MSHA biogenesis protein MshB [Thalassotalea profundi]